MTETEKARSLIVSLISRLPETPFEETALENAVSVQAEYAERFNEGIVSESQSNDGVSVCESRVMPAFGVCGTAKAILREAGLIRGGLPRARML